MGRKPNASKTVGDKGLLTENPSLERMEPQPSSGAMKSPPAADPQIQHENSHPRISPVKNLNSLVDGVMTHHERSPAEHEMHNKTFKKKKSKFLSLSVRRSERIKSAIVHPSNANHDIELIEDVTVSESEKDEPDTHVEQLLPELEPEPAENLSEKSLDEKVDYALHRIEALYKNIEFLKSKQVDENTGLYEAPSMASISYRSMYIDSQKKLEALTDENRKLTGKLENALGKIEVYEKENRVLVEVLDKMKEAVNALMVSNLAKTTEAAVNASTKAIKNACSASAVKRKRNAQES